MYESDWKWWSQSTNHWDGAIAGKLEKGGLSYWPEYRGLTKHHNWAIHGNIKNQDFLTSQVCVCVKTGGSVFTAICPSKFGENWVLKHWMYGTSWNQKKPAEVGQYSFLWKFTRFFTGVQASQKKHQCFAISKGTSLLFFSGTLARSTVFRNVFLLKVFAEPAQFESPNPASEIQVWTVPILFPKFHITCPAWNCFSRQFQSINLCL